MTYAKMHEQQSGDANKSKSQPNHISLEFLEVSKSVFENQTCSYIYILKMMAFHKTLISRVTQTCVVSPIGPRANFPFGRYQQESRASGTKGDADTLESLLGWLTLCMSEIWVLAIEHGVCIDKPSRN